MKSAPQVATKKPYQKPGLKIYGNIEALTAVVSVTAQNDGGAAGMNKTH